MTDVQRLKREATWAAVLASIAEYDELRCRENTDSEDVAADEDAIWAAAYLAALEITDDMTTAIDCADAANRSGASLIALRNLPDDQLILEAAAWPGLHARYAARLLGDRR